MATGPLGSINEAKVLGPDGKPWQDQHGYDRMPLPHVLQFNSIIGSAWRTYYHGQHDDAIKNDPEFAVAMRRDPLLMAMLQERKMSTVNRRWHIEVNDSRNPQQKAVADGLKIQLDKIPRKRLMFSYLLEAIWFGRYGSQLGFQDVQLNLPSIAKSRLGQKERVKVPIPVMHQPVLGDKIGYSYDGTPYIQVYGGKSGEIPGAKVLLTTNSRSVSLVGAWRTKFIIHMHESLDSAYWMGEQAGSIYGIGVRHVLYWLAWLKRELLANILTYAERTGMGLRIWYYQAGNDASKQAVEQAAYAQTDRTNILVPRQANAQGRSAEAVEFVESGSTVATLLLEILRHFDEEMERYVVGQSLSSGTEGAGLGGTAVAGLHATTKANLTEYDAENLGETLSQDLVLPMARWTYPESLVEEANPRFMFDVAPPDPAQVLSAVQAAWSMGVSFEQDSLRSLTGQPSPQDGDITISTLELQKGQLEIQQKAQEQAQQMAMQAQGGMQQPGAAAPAPDEEPSDQDFEDILAQLTGGSQQNARDGEPERYAAGFEGPHISPTGKTFWTSRSSPSSVKYTDTNPNASVAPGSESPSEVSAKMVPVPKQPKPPETAQAGAAPSAQGQAAAKPADPATPRKVAAKLLANYGHHEAPSMLSRLIAGLKAQQDDPNAPRLLKAALAIRDALEPHDQDHEMIHDQLLGGKKRYAAEGPPNTPSLVAELVNAPKPAKTVRRGSGKSLSPAGIAESASAQLGHHAGPKAAKIETDLGNEINRLDAMGEEHDLYHPHLVAKRVTDALEERGLLSPGDRPKRDRFIVNFSANGAKQKLNELNDRARSGDKKASEILSKVADASLRHLTSGIPGVTIASDLGVGLFEGYLEASASGHALMSPENRDHFLAGVEKFARNFGQKQVHVRGDVEKATPKVGHTYDDGSYNTPAYQIHLSKELSPEELDKVAKEAGLKAIVINKGKLEAYYVRDEKGPTIDEWHGQVRGAIRRLGGVVQEVQAGAHRLWNYGEGYETIPYGSIAGKLHPEGPGIASPNRRLVELMKSGDYNPEWAMTGDDKGDKKLALAAKKAGWGKDENGWSFTPPAKTSTPRQAVAMQDPTGPALYSAPLEKADSSWRVSTSVPAGTDAHQDSTLTTSIEGMAQDSPKLFAKNAQIIQEYPQYPEKKMTQDPWKAISTFKDVLKSNLRFLYNTMPEPIRNRSKLWYDGARKIAEQFSGEYGYSRPQVAGVMAALSPQNPWHRNVSQAERVLKIWKQRDTLEFSPEMESRARRLIAGESMEPGQEASALGNDAKEAFHAIIGRKFSEVHDVTEQAAWVRLYDETHSDRRYNVYSPEGEPSHRVMTKGGKEGKLAWGGLDSISKALRILQDGAPENISRQLGDSHKVRNFYNNILLPNNLSGDITMDTHAIAAGLLSPLSGSDSQVVKNLKGQDAQGYGGTYAIYQDAYKELAEELGILPRELQSITWEAVRGVFSPEYKRAVHRQEKSGEPGLTVKDLWNKFRAGKASLAKTQESILKLAGYLTPDWHRGGTPDGDE
jgi:phage gp29-like protein